MQLIFKLGTTYPVFVIKSELRTNQRKNKGDNVKNILLAGLFAMTAFTSLNASANNTEEEKYFKINKVTVQELNPMEEKLYFNDMDLMTTAPVDIVAELDIANIIFDKIVNLGKKAWALVELGRPVANVSTVTATALPQGVTYWNQLEQWQAPKTASYRITYENGFGANVVDFVYRIVYVAGGSVAGKGKYIGYATVQPGFLEVSWGFTFNSQITVPTVYNMGTSADPVGAMNLNVKWSIDTVLEHTEATEAFYINALGQMQKL